jgi:hypothetical protein
MDGRYAGPMGNAARVLAGAQVRIFPSVEAFSAAVESGQVEGVLIDNGYMEGLVADEMKKGSDETTATREASMRCMGSITIEARGVLVNPKSRVELERLILRIMQILPDVRKADMDRDFSYGANKLRSGYARMMADLADLSRTRMESLERLYDVKPATARARDAVAQATKIATPAAIALTEQAVENDLFSAASMEEAVKNDRVKPFFIYNVRGDGRKPQATDPESARKYLESMGYSGDVIKKIRFINGADASGLKPRYSDIRDRIIETVRSEDSVEIAPSAVGLGVIENEIRRAAPDEGVLLEVGQTEIDGRPFYASMNIVPTLLRVMAQYGTDTGRVEVPNVTFDALRGIFRYLPRALPIDYGRELRIYREAMKLIRTAA